MLIKELHNRLTAFTLPLLLVGALLLPRWIIAQGSSSSAQILTWTVIVVAWIMFFIRSVKTHRTTRSEWLFYVLLIVPVVWSLFTPYGNRELIYGVVLALGAFIIVKYTITPHNLTTLYATLSTIGVYESLYGLTVSRASLGLYGHFDNPAGFVALLAAILPFVLYFIQSRYKIVVTAGSIASAIVIYAIIMSQSRAGLLAMVAVLMWFMGAFLRPYWSRVSRPLRISSCTLLAVMLAAGCINLYFVKKDSADGRILIWRNSVAMISDKPLLGHGTNSFHAKYMLYQADYFGNHPTSQYADLAGNVKTPFNEYLGLTIEYGLIGLFIIGSFFFMTLRLSMTLKDRTYNPVVVSLGSVMVVALFSYPLHYPPVVIVLALDMALICMSGYNRRMQKWGVWIGRLLLTGIVATFGICTYRTAQLERSWQQLQLQHDTDNGSLDKYAALDSAGLGRHPVFLYNYAAVLNGKKETALSAKILERCTKMLNDADVAVMQADNYYQLKEYEAAEHWADLAANMCPNRFVPLYYKVMILNYTDRQDKAVTLAQKILDKPIKVKATDVYRVRLKLQQFLNEKDSLPQSIN